MQNSKDKRLRALRLVKSNDTDNGQPQLLMGSDNYYRKVESYATKIRSMSDVGEIIKVLDVVLSETRGLQFSDEVNAAQEQVKHAEGKIESLKDELEQLRELVQTDQMTGALNRRGMNEVFAREAARSDRHAHPLSLAILDLDDFKAINDTYGHAFGDRALIHLVSTAKETLRPSDAIVRFGGEEFVILLPDADTEEAMLVIRRLQNNLVKHCLVTDDEQLLPFTFSAGVASRSFSENQNALISRADNALYQAKRAGKNRIIPATLF